MSFFHANNPEYHSGLPARAQRILQKDLLFFILFCVFALFLADTPVFAAHKLKKSIPDTKQRIYVKGNRISLDIKDVDISEVLREIAEKTKIDLRIGERITGKIRIKLTDVTIEDALKILCRNRALVFEYLPDQKIYRVVRLAAFSESAAELKPEMRESRRPDQKKITPRDSTPKKEKQTPAENGHESASSLYDSKGRLRYKPGELLLKLKKGVIQNQAELLHHSIGSTVIGSNKRLRLQRVKLKAGLPEQAAMAFYSASDIVEHVEKHALRYPKTVPNDPYFAQQWGPSKIQATQAWSITTGNPAVIVAVIDTGVDYLHPDLAANIWTNTEELNGIAGIDDDNNGYVDDIRGWDFAGNDETNPADPDADPMDIDGHGTHVAGIIAAVGSNDLGIAGINWNARIMPLKVQANNGTYFDDWAVIEAIYYAIDMGANLVNCSFGGEESSFLEESAYADLKKANIISVCAAGNSGVNTDVSGFENYPSSYNQDNIVSVAASDINDNLPDFSNYGSVSVDVMAPGVAVYSTLSTKTFSHTEAEVRVEGTPYPALGMEYAGTTGENGITGTLYFCGLGYPEDFPQEVNSNIALIERGSRNETPFYFFEKVTNAQNKGAAAVIIYNNVVDTLDVDGGTLGSPDNWIPVVSVTQSSGEAFKALGNPLVSVINKSLITPYGSKSGTSMATPHVTGIAGLMLSQCPSLSYTVIKSAILDSIDFVPSVSDKINSGGRVNAYNALMSIFQPGDLSGNCQIDLTDAILASQLLAGLKPQSICLSHPCKIDLNKDGRIGSQELIYVLQFLSGLRQ